MISGLEVIFQKYERFIEQIDGVFEGVQKQFSECVSCKTGCADCCHALFDLTLVEALYVNRRFFENIVGSKKVAILEAADKTDRDLYRLKRKKFKSVEAGEKTEEQVLFEMAAERSRCPLLNDRDRCDLYAYRPITCRVYGIPTAIGGRGHTCGLSGFKEGESYPTVNLDPVHAKLHELSREIVATLRSTHIKMGEVLMPLSMALLTVFDESYLGVPKDKDNAGEEKKQD